MPTGAPEQIFFSGAAKYHRDCHPSTEEEATSTINLARPHRRDVFDSILHFLHLDSPVVSSRSGQAAHAYERDEPKSTTSANSGDYERSNSEAMLDSASSFTTPMDDAHAEAQAPAPSRKQRSTLFSSTFSALFPRRKRVPQQKHTGVVSGEGDADDHRALIIILEGDEDEERSDIIHTEDTVFDYLVRSYVAELTTLRKRTVWDSETGGEVTEEQLHTMYYVFFRQMKSLLAQQFSQIFPHGIRGTSLGMPDVAACVAGLLMIEMAITDEDIHSFAFNVLHGQRISLTNCPPSKRYLYFMFMAFKSTVPSFRSHMDAFRTAVVRYFYDHNSLKKSGHPFALPLQALLNALAPILMGQNFHKMTPPFYYYALKLERERDGDSDPEGDVASDKQRTLCDPVQQSSDTGSSLRRQRKRHNSSSSHWSTIVQQFKRGPVLGRGACGVVYRCTDENNGVFYALKELSLLTPSMIRRVRRHQEAQLDELEASNSQLGGSNAGIRLDELLTQKEQDELKQREKTICGEINMLKTLRNPFIVSYFGCSFDRRTLRVSILMEFCPKTLRAIVDELGPMRLPMIAHYAEQILQGIAFLHDNHVVHRDIKAANILVKDGGEAKVSDFGTAIMNELRTKDFFSDELDSLRRENRDDGDIKTLFSMRSRNAEVSGVRTRSEDAHNFGIQGTSLFLAPEVANGCLPTEASDIWSFGCLLIEMATGQYPWHEWTGGRDLPLEMIVFHIATAQAPPDLNTELAPRAASSDLFMDLLRACTCIDPVARPTARQLLAHPLFKQPVLGDDPSPLPQDLNTELPATDEVRGDLDEEPSATLYEGDVMSIVPNDSLAYEAY